MTSAAGDLPDRLGCTTPGANQITMAAGAAFVDGGFYINDADLALAPVSAGPGAIRHDSVVIRGSWGVGAEQYTARGYVKQGDHLAPPALVQVRNTTWEVRVCSYQIDEHGAVTNIVDEREYCQYPTEVVTEMLIDGVLSADAAGRAKMADGYFTAAVLAKFANGLWTADAAGRAKFADGIWNTAKLADNALSADAAGRAKMQDGFINNASVDKITDGTFAADAGSRAKFADSIWTLAKLVDGILSADAAGRLKMADLFVNTAKLDNDSVDDLKAGNRVPTFYRRQGGHADTWSIVGDDNRTPTLVMTQGGSKAWAGGAASSGTIDVTFPQAYSHAPLVFITGGSGSDVFVTHAIAMVITTGFRAYWRTISGGSVASVGFHWLAVGPG